MTSIFLSSLCLTSNKRHTLCLFCSFFMVFPEKRYSITLFYFIPCYLKLVSTCFFYRVGLSSGPMGVSLCSCSEGQQQLRPMACCRSTRTYCHSMVPSIKTMINRMGLFFPIASSAFSPSPFILCAQRSFSLPSTNIRKLHSRGRQMLSAILDDHSMYFHFTVILQNSRYIQLLIKPGHL